MAVLPLSSVPTGDIIFIDANVFVYGISHLSLQCQRVLERCTHEEVTGITLFEVVNEATHRWMLAEAQAKGLIARATAEVLGRKWDIIPKLTEYWTKTELLLSLNILFLSTTEAILRRAQAEGAGASLLTNDSVIVACMKHFGIASIATRDTDFERVKGIIVYQPEDI